MGTDRRILHVDIDAFFASVEQLDQPELLGKPIVVGSGKRGVVLACSYEARAFGVRSAMPISQALRQCPQVMIVPSRIWRYTEISHQIIAVLDGFSPLVAQASVDEAYLDITGMKQLFGSPMELGRRIKEAVLQATGLTCSVGIAPVKFLAKIASDLRKPDGLVCIESGEVADFLAELPVEKIPGVGPRLLVELHGLGVYTAGDVLRYPTDFWRRRLGKWGLVLADRARGIDLREVEPWYEPKSESAEHTLDEDTQDMELLHCWLLVLVERVGKRLRQQQLVGRTVTLKLRYANFISLTRSRTLAEPTAATRTIFETVVNLLGQLVPIQPVRLIGVRVSHFGRGLQQLLLDPEFGYARDETLDRTLDAIRERFGAGAVVRGRLYGFMS
ncbi:DNA polymerase IV [Desulfovibrionales bacterium]